MTTTIKTGYKPNYKDPRFIRRAQKCISWIETHIGDSNGKQIHSSKLTEIFGQQNNDLSSWLRSQLLLQHGSYVVGQKSFVYTINKSGLQNLKQDLEQVININTGSIFLDYDPLEEIYQKHKQEIDSKEFNYNLKSNRYWHPLQNLRREVKEKFWKKHGLPFNYDIQACAPTLLYQVAIAYKVKPILLYYIKDYINNRQFQRQRVADLINVSLEVSKTIFNAIFNGAKLAANFMSQIFELIGKDKDKMKALQDDQYLTRLRNNIKRVWARIEQVHNKSFKTATEKWRFYFAAERIVLDVIKKCLIEHGYKVFTEHDGFRVDREIDQERLQRCIEEKTSFKFKVVIELKD